MNNLIKRTLHNWFFDKVLLENFEENGIIQNSLKDILLWTWCLPQSLIGILYYLTLRNKIIKKKNWRSILIYSVDLKRFGGVSLGKFIFLEKKLFVEREIRHEYGHTLQGYIFGPLYLLIIALPSAFWYWFSKKNSKYKKVYFEMYPEKWADKLGGVKRV